MARAIKVHEMGRTGMESREVDISEANRILEDAALWGWVVIDAKTQQVIWQIDPNTDEIMVIGMLGGG